MWKPFLILIFIAIVRTQTLYELLGISPKATQFQIKKAFRKLTIKYHPDKNTDAESQKRFIEINKAYQVLSDQTKRVTYDNFGEQGLFDLQNRAKPKGGDYRTGMEVTLQDLYNGAEKVFSFRRGQLCKACKGTGDASATLSTCTKCNGSGHLQKKVKVNGQDKVLDYKCPKCEGKGQSNKEICPVCKGQKITIQHRDLHFNIEPGRQLWQKQFFKGESEQGVQFYPGDVILTLNMHPHKRFRREHQHLYTDVTISLQEALLGFDKSIQHLDGKSVMISSEPGINDGEEIVIEGKGMPIRSDPGKFGNLYVKVKVDYNLNFSNDQLQIIKKIFAKNETQRRAQTGEQL